MKKKIILMLATVALLVCAFAISVSAAECIDGIYYTFSGTEATVSSDNQKSCQLETVVIPEKVTFNNTEYTVTSIVTKAFGSGNSGGGNGNIKSLTVPSTVTSIGEYAFANCPNLTTAYCKSAKIGSRMFQDCSVFAELTLENTVEIGGNAFNRTILTSVVIPATVTKIDGYAFKQCTGITKVVILGSVIGSNMFDGCTALNTLVLTEKIETFGEKCLGNATNNAFTTYYTGTDYERIKTLGSYTSRLREAKCYSYSDYIANGYTDKYKLIYETNLCVAAFDGAHTEPRDDGDCTTALVCSVCGDYAYKEAKEHTIGERVTYASFLQDGEYYVGCTNDGCTYGTSEKLNALFTCLGYSAPTSGNGGIALGFKVNSEAITTYTQLTGKTLSFGVFAGLQSTLLTNDVFDKDGKMTDGVLGTEIETSHSVFEIKVTGFADDQKDIKLALGAYVKVTEGEEAEYSYLQPGKPLENENYCFVSYNDVVSNQPTQDAE